MKNWKIGIVLAALLVGSSALAVGITTGEKYRLNHWGNIGSKTQLGTLIENAEKSTTAPLAEGYILKGSSAGYAEALDANDDGKILVGNGTALTSVAVSGDATLASTGALTIGSNAVGSAEITDLSVATGDIAANAVTEAKIAACAGAGLNAARSAKAYFDPTGTPAQGSVGTVSLGVTLPAGAVIQRSWFETITQVVGVGSSVGFHCETDDNIYANADITGNAAGTLVTGVSDGAIGNMKKITSACNITADVAGADVTAGKIGIFVDYKCGD